MIRVALLIALVPISGRAQDLAGSMDAGLAGVREASLRARAEQSVFIKKVREAAPGAPMRLGSKTFQGTLRLAGERVIELLSTDGLMQLREGPVTLMYGSPSLRSLFNGDRSVAVIQDGRTAFLPARSADFQSFGSFTTLDDASQPYRLRGVEAVAQLGREEREARRSCTYAGYCMGCAGRIGFDGEMKMDCGLGLHVNCSGSHHVRERVTRFSTTLTVEIISRETGRRAGAVVGTPTSSESVETIKILGGCR